MHELIERFHALMSEDPNDRLSLGILQDVGRLPDPSWEAIRDRAERAAELARAFRDLPREALDFDEALDSDLAAETLEALAFRLTCPLGDAAWFQRLPRAADDMGDPLFLLMMRDPRPDAERLEDALHRLEGVPAFLEGTLGRMREPVDWWVDIEREKVAGLPGLLDTVLAWAREAGWEGLPHLEAAASRARDALGDYARRLGELPRTSSFSVGEDLARATVHHNGLDLSLEDLHGIAVDFLARNRERIEALRGELARRHGLPEDIPAPALHRELARRYAALADDEPVEAVLDHYRREQDRIVDFIRERDLFPIPEGQDLRILRTPDFMAPSIPAGAMLPPPAFAEGTRTSLVYLTLSDELRDEHTRLGIPVMMLHEGIPGHHLQLATAGMHPSIVRRHVHCNHHAEGWTTMLEDYLLDLGLCGDLTDEVRFLALRDIARIGARVAIDLAFMTGDRRWLDVGVDVDLEGGTLRDAAGRLLEAVTGFVPGRVKAELNWYSQERGYPLSYLAGNHLVWALRREVAASRSHGLEGLDIDRAFHRVYLQSGNMPLKHLRRVMVREGLLEA